MIATGSGQDQSVLAPQVDPTAEAEPIVPGAPKPNLERTGSAIESKRGRSVSMIVVAVLAVLYTLYFAREFLLPIAFALLLNFLLSPVVRWFARFRVQPPFGAAIILIALLSIIGAGGYELSGSIQGWAASAPQTLATAEVKLRKLIRPIERVTRTAEQVATAASATAGTAKPAEVVVKGPSLVARLFGTTQRFVASVLEMVILLYFLLPQAIYFCRSSSRCSPVVATRRRPWRLRGRPSHPYPRTCSPRLR